jgi:predicted Zn-dependent protease
MRQAVGVIGLIAAVGLLAAPRDRVTAQEPCRPPMPPPSAAPNIFSEAQENDLGDAIAEQLERDLRVIDEPEIAGELRRIGQRLVRHLPATSLRIQFFLIDLPDANAFVLPGGRIYASRKLISFSQGEDELAAVLGHELGHLVLRQQTIAFTRWLREVLKVTSLGDRKDVFERYRG